MPLPKYQSLLDEILRAIDSDDFILPTLPGVAANIQIQMNNPDTSAEQLVQMLCNDPSISPQLIKAANSAKYSGKPLVNNARVAVTRLGYLEFSNLLSNITSRKLFHSNNPFSYQKITSIYQHSRKVGVLSYVIASRHPHLSPDIALLGGLIHDIGVLPLCMHIETNRLDYSEALLNEIIENSQCIIGMRLLNKWNFSKEIISVIAESENIYDAANTKKRADYADVVYFANLQNRSRTEQVNWPQLAVLQRLKFSEEECLNFLDLYAERISQLENMLGIDSVPHVPAQIPPQARPPQQGVFSSLMPCWA